MLRNESNPVRKHIGEASRNTEKADRRQGTKTHQDEISEICILLHLLGGRLEKERWTSNRKIGTRVR